MTPPLDPIKRIAYCKRMSETIKKKHAEDIEWHNRDVAAIKKAMSDPNTREKMSQSAILRCRVGISEKTRKKMSIATSGENNPRYGKHCSEITRKKISEAALNRSKDPVFIEKLCKAAKIRNTRPEWIRKQREVHVELYKDPEYVKRQSESHKGIIPSIETRKRMSKAMLKRYSGRPVSETTRKKMSDSMKGIPKSRSTRIKLSATKQGCSLEEWNGFKRFERYCEKFDNPLKERTRAFWGNQCVLCKKSPNDQKRKNGTPIKLSVHHVFLEKKACCESLIEELDVIRKRLPLGVARFGEPQFSEEEIKYIRMMVPLCMGCHVKMLEEHGEIPYEQTKYRKYFTELILSKGGKCYYTKEEFA